MRSSAVSWRSGRRCRSSDTAQLRSYTQHPSLRYKRKAFFCLCAHTLWNINLIRCSNRAPVPRRCPSTPPQGRCSLGRSLRGPKAPKLRSRHQPPSRPQTPKWRRQHRGVPANPRSLARPLLSFQATFLLFRGRRISRLPPPLLAASATR